MDKPVIVSGLAPAELQFVGDEKVETEDNASVRKAVVDEELDLRGKLDDFLGCCWLASDGEIHKVFVDGADASEEGLRMKFFTLRKTVDLQRRKVL